MQKEESNKLHAMESNDVKQLILQKLNWKSIDVYQRFLKPYRWTPKFLFYNNQNRLYIAVDIVYNQLFSESIYRKQTALALSKNSNLKYCLFCARKYPYDKIEPFCRKEKIGLKIYSDQSILTLIPLSFEKRRQLKAKKLKREGWFPKTIIDGIKNVNRIKFAPELKQLIAKIEHVPEDQQVKVIQEYIKKVFSEKLGNIARYKLFLRLKTFEELLNMDRDHFFHSIRVFFIGCIIIDKYYDLFLLHYRNIFPGVRKINLEYMWLLTALLHDVGRIKQQWSRMITKDETKNKQLLNGIKKEMKRVWKKKEYIVALDNIVSLIEHCCQEANSRQPFTGNQIRAKTNPLISSILRESYNNRTSHGVISCFEVASELLKNVWAPTGNLAQSLSNTFLLYHIFTPMLAIALHDYHIWEDLVKINIFPLKLTQHPLAVLLIYIDTWDDYKRDKKPKISIDRLNMVDKNITVYITWHNTNEYLKEKIKYTSFKENINCDSVNLEIVISNEIKNENTSS